MIGKAGGPGGSCGSFFRCLRGRNEAAHRLQMNDPSRITSMAKMKGDITGSGLSMGWEKRIERLPLSLFCVDG